MPVAFVSCYRVRMTDRCRLSGIANAEVIHRAMLVPSLCFAMVLAAIVGRLDLPHAVIA